jgi:hypothetical protein
LFCSSASAFETSFWVWQRSEPLSDSERAELSAQGVHAIYWQIGELENVGEAWRWKARFSFPGSSASGLRFVPVVRLESLERSPFSKSSIESLLGALAGAAKGAEELQLDYDAPDRLIAEYAAALKKIHTLVPKLSITALPHWARGSALNVLEGSVDELAPMLYDFEPDPIVEGAAPLPLLDPEKLAAWLADWSKCKTGWCTGLPAFARVTLFDPNGKSRGHVREWNWDDLCFNKSLAPLQPTALGLTLFKAQASTRITNTPVKTEQRVAVRWPDRAALIRVIEQVRKTNARGVVFFRLPDSSAPSGWSLRQLGHLDAAPHLVFRKAEAAQQLELVNESDGDLAPRLAGAHDKGGLERGYALEVDAPAAVFRDAHEGDFWRVIGRVDPDGARQAVVVPLATRLTFWFSHLRARQSLRTGVIQLAPGAAFSQIRYRVLSVPANSEWKQIEE